MELIARTYLAYKGEPDKPKIDRSKYTPDQLKAMDESQKKHSTPIIEVLNLRFTAPLSEFTNHIHNFDYILMLYGAYKNHGSLPYEGLISDQPYKIIEIFNVIGAVINSLQEQERKAQEKKKIK